MQIMDTPQRQRRRTKAEGLKHDKFFSVDPNELIKRTQIVKPEQDLYTLKELTTVYHYDAVGRVVAISHAPVSNIGAEDTTLVDLHSPADDFGTNAKRLVVREPQPKCKLQHNEISLRLIFQKHVSRWKKDVLVCSITDEMFSHPSYLRIIGLGLQVLPLLFREIQRESDYWFVALEAITGVHLEESQNDRGDIEKMTLLWLNWAKHHGYINDEGNI